MNRILRVCSVVLILILATFVLKQQHSMIIPVQVNQNKNVTLIKLQSIGIYSEKVATAVNIASSQSGVSADFLIALMHTESTGDEFAVSSKKYRGLMQIPFAVYYADANMLIGAHIFNEKMVQAKNNIIKALCLYKGYPVDSERGIQQANKVMVLYNKLREVGV
jgi:soluble lytic murein transglycosylase-like protein